MMDIKINWISMKRNCFAMNSSISWWWKNDIQYGNLHAFLLPFFQFFLCCTLVSVSKLIVSIYLFLNSKSCRQKECLNLIYFLFDFSLDSYVWVCIKVQSIIFSSSENNIFFCRIARAFDIPINFLCDFHFIHYLIKDWK